MLSTKEMIEAIWQCIGTDPETGERFLRVGPEEQPKPPEPPEPEPEDESEE